MVDRKRREDRVMLFESDGARALRLRLATNVRALRALRKMTQRECAEACSIDRTLMQRIENGSTNFTSTTLACLCAGLRCDVSALFQLVGAPPDLGKPGRPRRAPT
jgi:transcriptional regulator with XRE-family HTH domain